jgi:hypothetical protein
MALPFSWSEVSSIEPPTVCFVASSDSELDDLAFSGVRQGIAGVIRVVRGDRCDIVASLFHEWAAALQFPYYFGRNWNAYEECLGDLAWLGRPPYTIFITNLPEILPSSSADRAQFFDIIRLSADIGRMALRDRAVIGSRPRGLHLVFHAKPQQKKLALERLIEHKLSVVEREVRI